MWQAHTCVHAAPGEILHMYPLESILPDLKVCILRLQQVRNGLIENFEHAHVAVIGEDAWRIHRTTCCDTDVSVVISHSCGCTAGRHLREEVIKDAGYEATGGCDSTAMADVAQHCVCLPTASLAIGEHTCIVPIKAVIYDRPARSCTSQRDVKFPV